MGNLKIIKIMTDYTVVTAVDIVAYTAMTAACPALSVKVEGSDSDWATDAIITICSSCEDLDGYKLTAVMSSHFTIPTTAALGTIGGCIATATTASAVCIEATWALEATVAAGVWALDAITAEWVATTAFAAAVTTAGTAYLAGTGITAATNYLTAEPSACVTAVAATVAATTAACVGVAAAGTGMFISTASLLGDVVTWTWMQPDEDSDGYTTTMPRF